jgi:hypothetical protein
MRNEEIARIDHRWYDRPRSYRFGGGHGGGNEGDDEFDDGDSPTGAPGAMVIVKATLREKPDLLLEL